MRRDKRGSVAIEFALFGSALVLLLMAATDLSLAIRARAEVGNAARAGAEYAAINCSSSCSSSGIATAVTSATPLAVTPTFNYFLWLRHRERHHDAELRNGVRGGGHDRHLCKCVGRIQLHPAFSNPMERISRTQFCQHECYRNHPDAVSSI